MFYTMLSLSVFLNFNSFCQKWNLYDQYLDFKMLICEWYFNNDLNNNRTIIFPKYVKQVPQDQTLSSVTRQTKLRIDIYKGQDW